jgi:peptidoglycan/xylan/chitin deacetylase (PgdA/CDA1 family)
MQWHRYMRRMFGDRHAPVILMCHRVAEPAWDPWALSIAPARFDELVRRLAAERIPLSMSEFVARLEAGTLPARAVAVTFDDGYIDNLRTAKPVLEAHRVPATVFLATGYVGRRSEFWWDELARLILGRRDALEGAIAAGARAIAVRLDPFDRHDRASIAWRAEERPRTARQQLYLEVWTELRALAPAAREEALERTRQLFGSPAPSPDDLPMTAEEVRCLVSSTRIAIDIGAHSESHRPLTTVPVADRGDEIRRSGTACAAIAGKAIEGFAYPHGDVDSTTSDLVRANGFRWACSTRHAAVDRDRFDLFDLPRVQMRNWTASELERALGRAAMAA